MLEEINERNDEITRISEGISDKDILNEDARIMNDSNDNDTPLEEECYGCATQRYGCEHDEENKYDNPRDLLRFIMEVATASSKANWGNDKDWQQDFQFIVTEIDEFLNG